MKTSSTLQKNKSMHLFVATLLFVCAVGALFLIHHGLSGKENNQSVDIKLSQFSQEENNYNMPLDNEDVQLLEKKSSPNVLLANEYGTWIWKSPVQMSNSYVHSVVNNAKNNGINTLYVTIDDYLEIDSLSDGQEKDQKKVAYSKALENVINIASAKNISVDAEAGWRNWAEKGDRYKASAIVDYVIEYNLTHPSAKLRGFQYDVEPYLLPTYEKNKASILTNFVKLIDETVIQLDTSSLRFSVVIPHFYDDAQSWTPAVTYNGKKQHTFNHILDILDQRPGSSIILMSYRNFAIGKNGSIQISEIEINEATTNGQGTKIIVGQEAGDVEPAYVTFFGFTKKEYLEQINIIQSAFKNKSAFGGIAVHYLEPFLSLKLI